MPTSLSYQITCRSHYLPPSFLIDSVELVFDLDPQRTVVTSRMRVRRNPIAAPSTALHLDGEQLEFIRACIDNVPCTPELHTDEKGQPAGLTLFDVPDTFELTLSNACSPVNNTQLMGLYLSTGRFFTQCESEGFRRITYFIDRPDVMARYTVTLRAPKAGYPVLLSNGNLIASGMLEDGRHFASWEDPFAKPCYLFALVAGQLVCRQTDWVSGSGQHKLLQVWSAQEDIEKTSYALDALTRSLDWDEQRFGLELDLDRFMVVAVGDFNMGAMENKGLNIFNTQYVLADPQTATDSDYSNIESVIGHEYFHNWTGNRVTCRDWFQLTLKEGLTVFRDQEFSADSAACEADLHIPSPSTLPHTRAKHAALTKTIHQPNSPRAKAARATKRIEDVCRLRRMQFAEDAGPMAHPIRPEQYLEISNFYTATIYEKGAEVVRMIQTLVGREGFLKGMKLYFQRHDGQAVTCDDFRQAMADANQRDLTQFERWYTQSGTPRVQVSTHYDVARQRYSVTLRQSLPAPLVNTASAAPSSVAQSAPPLLIPFAIGLLGSDGRDLPLYVEGSSSDATAPCFTKVLELTQMEQTFHFTSISRPSVPSLLRDFSAPVVVDYNYTEAELTTLFATDSDPFNRWEAGQRLAMQAIMKLMHSLAKKQPIQVSDTVVLAFSQVLQDTSLTPAFRAQALSLPTEADIYEQLVLQGQAIDPAAVYGARKALREYLARTLYAHWMQTYQDHLLQAPYAPTLNQAGARALKNLALYYLSACSTPQTHSVWGWLYGEETEETTHTLFWEKPFTTEEDALSSVLGAGLGGEFGAHQDPEYAIASLAQAQYDTADNMTDRAAALSALLCIGEPPQTEAALADFYTRFANNPLAIDKWFALQARQDLPAGAEKSIQIRVRHLTEHPAFSLHNPNRARALIFNFISGNPAHFHTPDGQGYAFWAEYVLALDVLNPQIAARLARALERWRNFIPSLRDKMQHALQRVLARACSKDVREVIEQALK